MSDVRQVTITDCSPKKRGDGSYIEGTSQFGKPWRIHSVLATDDTGLPIQDELVSFEPLPLGAGTYEFQMKSDPKYGTSYTLSVPKGSRQPRSRMEDDPYEMLRETVGMLSERVGALEAAYKRMGGFVSTPSQTDVPAIVPPPVPVPDDDPPPF